MGVILVANCNTYIAYSKLKFWPASFMFFKACFSGMQVILLLQTAVNIK